MSSMNADIESWLSTAAAADEDPISRLNALGLAVNHCEDVADLNALQRADEVAAALTTFLLEPSLIATLHYVRANIWSARGRLKPPESSESWDWQGEKTEHEIF